MLGGLFALKQLHLEYFDGYIYAGVTPVYVPAPLTIPNSENPGRALPMNGALPHWEMENGSDYDHDVRYNGHNFQFI